MKTFSRIYFIIFTALFAGLLLFTVYNSYKKTKSRAALDFRSAVIRMKPLRASSTDYFVELANGARVIMTSPNGTRYAVQVSDAGVLSTVAL